MVSSAQTAMESAMGLPRPDSSLTVQPRTNSYLRTRRTSHSWQAGWCPALVDPSNSRIRAGALTEEQLIAGIRDYDADFIALWTGKLSGGRNDMDHRRLQLLIVR